MTKPTQIWPGERMRRFFRAVFGAEPGVDAELAERLAQRTERYVNRLWVWDAEPKDSAGKPSKSIDDSVASSLPESIAQLTEAGAPWPDTSSVEEAACEAKVAESSQDQQTETPAVFDPYAFSVMVVLARQGPDGLHAMLSEIRRPKHLRQLAEAQHISLEPHLKSASDLRNAIVAGAAQRIADRRAAAS